MHVHYFLQHTFQAIVSTDGTRSFVTLLYQDYIVARDAASDLLGTIGFNAGDQRRNDTVARGDFVKEEFSHNNTFRIDG